MRITPMAHGTVIVNYRYTNKLAANICSQVHPIARPPHQWQLSLYYLYYVTHTMHIHFYLFQLQQPRAGFC